MGSSLNNILFSDWLFQIQFYLDDILKMKCLFYVL